MAVVSFAGTDRPDSPGKFWVIELWTSQQTSAAETPLSVCI